MLIESATVVTVDAADRVLEPGWIRIANGVIEQVSEAPLAPDGGEVRIDATGMVVIPGLINAHTHLYQTLIRGIYEDLPFREWLRRIYHCGLVLDEDDYEVAARVGAYEALRGGTTTIVEHHFLNGDADSPGATIGALRDVGVRAVFARTAMDIGDLAPERLLETPEAAVAAAEALVRRHAGDESGMIRILVGPNTPGVSAGPDMARAMTEYAQAAGVRQSMHVAESRSARETVAERYGVDGVVRWLDTVGALQGPILAPHSVHIDAGEISLMAERGVAISHNPVCNLFLGDGIAPIVEARRAGVTVGLGSDGAASNNRQDMFEVLKLAAILQRGRLEDPHVLPPRDALRMATLDAARALGLDDLVGSIEPGKRADLAILDLRRAPRNVALHDPVSQLVHCAAADDVDTVLVDGVVRLSGGRPTGFDPEALLARAQERGIDLAGRLEALGTGA